MSYALGPHTAAQGNTDYSSSNIDTSGMNFLLAAIAYAGGNAPTLTDNKSNTWAPLTDYGELTGGDRCHVRLFYVENPTVGTGHHVSLGNGSNGGFSGVCFAAFSGALTSGVFDTGTDHGFGQSTGATTIQPGSCSPNNDNSLIVVARGIDDPTGDAHSINLGFTIIDTQDVVTGVSFGVSLAYLVQTTKTAVNPTFTRTSVPSSGGDVAAIAAFKSAAGVTPQLARPLLSLSVSSRRR